MKYVFGVPGSTTVSLISSISDSKRLKFISSLNENASLAMADGYSRASSSIGVVLLHTTPGLTTALPNLYNSYVDNIPLLILVGDVNSKFLIKEPGLALDGLEDLAKPLTRWTYFAKSGSDVVTAIERSASIFRSPETGPCCIIIPEDILEDEQREEDDDDKSGEPNHRLALEPLVVKPDEKTIQNLIAMLDESNWPLIIIGREIKSEKAVNAIVDFCNLLSLPAMLESPYPSAYSVGFPQNDPCYVGLFRRESEALKGADLIVGLGGEMVTERKYYEDSPFSNSTKVIHISQDPWQLGKNIPTDVSIIASPERTAGMLAELARAHEGNVGKREQRKRRIGEICSKRREEREKLLSKRGDGHGIKPWELVSSVKRSLGDKDFLIVDEGVVASSYFSEIFEFTRPGSLIGRSAGCLGWGLGAAIGAKLAEPKKIVIAIVGDGALMFSPQALWTAAHERISIIVLVCNNNGYSSVRLSFDSFARRSKRKVSVESSEILYPRLDLVSLGKALGVTAVSVTDEIELPNALDSAIISEMPYLLDVHVDPREKGFEGSVGMNSTWT